MSPITHLSVLALASAALASPYAHGHGHRRHQQLHATGGSPAGYGSSSAHGTGAPFPYPTGNGTSGWGSTGLPYASGSSADAYASSSEASPKTATEYGTHTETVYTTIHLAHQSAASGYGSSSVAAADYGSGAAADSCAAVTVTSTQQVTQYVTEGSAPSTSEAAPSYSSASSSSSTEGSPVESSSSAYPAPAYSAPAYGSSSSSEASPASTSAPADSAPASSSSTAAPASTSQYSAPSYNKESSSSSSAPVLTATYAVKQQDNAGSASISVASSTMGNTASTSAATSSSGGKRGLAYNDVSLTECFTGSSEISWAYNWASSSGDLSKDFTFIPTLWGAASEFTGSWNDNAKKAIESGSTHLFSFNEPDHTAQANLGASAAADAYCTYMNPFAGQAKLCAPAVTNGGGDMGLTWLKNFLSACGSECHIDCINIHWYDSASNVDYFKSHIEDAIEIADGKPIYVSEFGATGSDDEIAAFLKEVMPWMDSNDNM